MKIGYARVSTQDQNLALQLDALDKEGCEKIFQDKASGAVTKRPGLNQALEAITAGDVLVVWKIDRLGRNTLGLLSLIEELDKKEAHFLSLSDGINTQGTQGRFFLRVMAAFAEMERDLLRERTNAGLVAAKQRGRVGGRPCRMTPSKLEMAKKLLSDGIPLKDVSQGLEVSISTLYRWLPASTRDVPDLVQEIAKPIERRPLSKRAIKRHQLTV